MPIKDKIVNEILVSCARHCCICRKFRPLHLHIHHIVEQSDGGSDEMDNLIPICTYCHSDVHTKTQLTRRFTTDELKMHRKSVFELVDNGRLPSPDSIITNSELDYIVSQLANKIANNEINKHNKNSLKILYSCYIEESNIKIGSVLYLQSRKEVPNRAVLDIGNQQISCDTDDQGTPLLFNSLVQDGLIEKSELEYRITFKGIAFCEAQINAYGRYTLIKCKCLICSLHFIICTFYPERHAPENITCPECGQKEGAILRWKEKALGQIFELVPGNSKIDM